MCTVLLPPGDNPIAVNKYIISYYIISILDYHIGYKNGKVDFFSLDPRSRAVKCLFFLLQFKRNYTR